MSRRIEPDAIYSLVGVADPHFAPDGQQLGFCAILDRSRRDGSALADHVDDPERWPNRGLHAGDARCLAAVLSRWTLSRLSEATTTTSRGRSG